MKEHYTLYLRVLAIGVMLFTTSFASDTDIWKDVCTYQCDNPYPCYYGFGKNAEIHHHWNFRGWIWVVTGLILCIISIISLAQREIRI